MRRILLMLTATSLMVALMETSALPAFAQIGDDSEQEAESGEIEVEESADVIGEIIEDPNLDEQCAGKQQELEAAQAASDELKELDLIYLEQLLEFANECEQLVGTA